MIDTPSNSAHLSQIETQAPRSRIVLLGASNLSLTFPTIIETARAMFAAPIEFIVAKGFGRSYGQESKFFGKKFPGILQCGLWDALDAARPAPTVAIVADVGNDLAYQAPVDSIMHWIETTLDRLAAHGARTVLNNVPIASLRSVGAARYYLFRELFFSNCRLSRIEMLSRADELSRRPAELAAVRKTPAFAGDFASYGLDPIHPRRRAAGAIWQQMLGAANACAAPPTLVLPRYVEAWRIRQLKPAAWSNFGWPRRASQPACRLADGTTIAIY